MQKKLSTSELEVMTVLWNSKKQLTSTEIMDILSETKQWKPGTIWSFLGRLSEKGSLNIEKVGKINYYSPSYSLQDYQKFETMDFINTVHNGSVTSLYAALSQGDTLDETAINELKQWIDNYKA